MKTRFPHAIRFWTTAGITLTMAGVAPAVYAIDWLANSRAQEQFSALVQQAYAAHESGNGVQALALLDQADKVRANVADSANLRGAVYLRQGVFDKAEAAFSRAVACDPKLWAARFNLAEVPFRQKDYARARSRFDSLLTQTNRFKEQNQWELVQYKAVLCSILLDDEAGAQRRIARLPEGAAAVTPARLCAQAAVALARKDNATASRLLAESQHGKYSMNTLNVFVSALELSGWVNPSPLLTATLATAGTGGSRALAGSGSLVPGGGSAPRPLMPNLPIMPGAEPELPVADRSAPRSAPPLDLLPSSSPAPETAPAPTRTRPPSRELTVETMVQVDR